MFVPVALVLALFNAAVYITVSSGLNLTLLSQTSGKKVACIIPLLFYFCAVVLDKNQK